jgi:hypothetical protein
MVYGLWLMVKAEGVTLLKCSMVNSKKNYHLIITMLCMLKYVKHIYKIIKSNIPPSVSR